MKRRVVVTGLGLLTSAGKGWEPYWKAALEGTSSISSLDHLCLNGFPSKFAGIISDFNPKDFIQNRKSLKVMSREIQLAVAASQLAMEDAGNIRESYDALRMGLVLGTGAINTDLNEMSNGILNGVEDGQFSMPKFGRSGIRSLYPLWMLKYIPNMPACHIAIVHQFKGPNNTITTSSASGAQAIGEAFRIIERGDADLMMAGGTDSKINPMGISRFHLLKLLSQKNHSAKEAYSPFDETHDGIVLGEGGGLIVLETLEGAKKRGAKIYAELVGYGTSSDYNPDPRETDDSHGKRLAMQSALQDAKIKPEQISCIVANGSGVPKDDLGETRAIGLAFENNSEMDVTTLKPIAGHLVYGSGGLEFGAGALMVKEGKIPPVINLKNPHEGCSLRFVRSRAKEKNVEYLLFNSSSFGGQNASLVMKKCGEAND